MRKHPIPHQISLEEAWKRKGPFYIVCTCSNQYSGIHPVRLVNSSVVVEDGGSEMTYAVDSEHPLFLNYWHAYAYYQKVIQGRGTDAA